MSTTNRIRTATASALVLATCGVGQVAFAGETGRATTTLTPAAAVAGHPRAGFASLTLEELKARITTAIDSQAERISALAAKIEASERLTAAQKAKAAEKLAAYRDRLARLRTDVNAQTTKAGVVKVLRDARASRTAWYGYRWRDGWRPGTGEAQRTSWGERDRSDDGDRDGDRDRSDDGDRDRDGDRDGWCDEDHRDEDHRDGDRGDGGDRDGRR